MLLGLSRRGVVGVYGTRPKDFFREKSSPCDHGDLAFCSNHSGKVVGRVSGEWACRERRRCRAAVERRFCARCTLENVSLEWEQTSVDALDPESLGRWWQQALGWIIVNDEPTEFEIRPAPDQLPGLLFVPVPELKSLKNRLHLDFRPDDQDREVDRLLGLGAVRVDVGQGEQPWVVLADPEGNEFCVLGERSTN